MKKFIQLLIGLAVASNLVFGVFLLNDTTITNAGWNSGASVAALQCGSTRDCPIQPNAGWNS